MTRQSLLALLVLAGLASCSAWLARPACMRPTAVRLSTRSASALQMSSAENAGILASLKLNMQNKVLPVLLGAAVLLGPLGGKVEDANAARSGGRSGGSSFRAAPSVRSSSTALRSSYGNSGYGGGRGMTIMPVMPMYSPFGFGGGFGFSPFGGFMPINLNVIILAGVAYAVYTALSNRAGGSDFSNDGTSGSLGNGASVLKLQLSLSSDWNQPGNIMETLTRLAERNSAMTGRTDLSRLLSDSSLALLRRQSDWNSAAYEGEQFMFGPQKAEPYFQRLAVSERAKFEEENSSSTVAVIKSSNSGTSKPTEVVVSLVVAIRGSSSAFQKNVNSVSDVKKCLQGLAADALTDEGDNIMAVEVLWTPSEPGTVISEREIIEDYPELIRL